MAPTNRRRPISPVRILRLPDPLPEFLRVDRVARMLDVSPKRVYQLIRDRELEAIRIGPRQTRIFTHSVEGYVRARLAEMEPR